jgi:hypothetical protein
MVISNRYLMKMNIKISSQELVFYTKGDDVAILKGYAICSE